MEEYKALHPAFDGTREQKLVTVSDILPLVTVSDILPLVLMQLYSLCCAAVCYNYSIKYFVTFVY